MSFESEQVEGLVTRVLALAGDEPDENGKPTAWSGRLCIVGGRSSLSRSTKLAAPIVVGPGVKREALTAVVLARLRVAKENVKEGGLWVAAMGSGKDETHPYDATANLLAEGEGGPGTALVLDDERAGVGGAIGAVAHANAHTNAALMQSNHMLLQSFIDYAGRTEEMRLVAATAMGRLEVYEKFAGRAELAEALKHYAPVAEAAFPEALRAMTAYFEREAAKDRAAAERERAERGLRSGDGKAVDPAAADAPDPAKRVRDAMSGIETAAAAMERETLAAVTAGAMGAELRAELMERMGRLVGRFGFTRAAGGAS